MKGSLPLIQSPHGQAYSAYRAAAATRQLKKLKYILQDLISIELAMVVVIRKIISISILK